MQLFRRARFALFATILLLPATIVLASAPAADAARTDPLDTWQSKRIDLPANDIEYDATRDVVLVTVDNTHASLGNELVELDPETGAVGRHVFVGSDPGSIALADDGTVAYVGMIGANQIVKVDLATFTIASSFTTGWGQWSGAHFTEHLAVPPGRNDLVVVSFQSKGQSPRFTGLWAYENGVALANHVDEAAGPNSFAFADADTIYGLSAEGFGTFFKMTLGPDGVTKDSSTNLNIDGGMQMAGADVVTDGGALIDPGTSSITRYFGAGGGIAPTPEDDRITFAYEGSVSQYVLSTGELIGSKAFTGLQMPWELRATQTGFVAVSSTDWWTPRALYLLGPDVTPEAVALPDPAPSSLNTMHTYVAPVQGRDLAFDASRRLLYASVGDDAPAHANQVVALDPYTGDVEKTLQLANSPDELAISDDNSTLYVGFTKDNAVARINLSTFTEASRFSLGESAGQPVHARDIDVRPGDPDVVVVAEVTSFINMLVVYDNGVARPELVNSGYVDADKVAFADASTLYGVVTDTTSPSFYAFVVDDNGVHNTASKYDATGLGAFSDFSVVGGLAWLTSGIALESTAPNVATSLADYGAITVEPAANRMFQLHDSKVTEYELNTGRPINFRYVPGNGIWNDQTMLQTGTGLAALETYGILLLNPDACDGQLATIVANSFTTVGTAGDDVIVGTSGPDHIDGGGGNDLICGWGGDDTVTGGEGNDTIFGGGGDDSLSGGTGADDLDGGSGNDTVTLTPGTAAQAVDLDSVADDGLAGENDNVRPTNEVIVGSDGPDTIVGSANNDTLRGMGGNDRLYGMGGNDTLSGGAGADDLNGGTGVDTVLLDNTTSSKAVTLDNTANDGAGGEHDNVRSTNEVIVGSPGNDFVVGSAAAEVLQGGAGNDTLDGGGGNDILVGGQGDDVLRGGAGNDQMRGDEGADDFDGGSGTDLVALSNSAAPHSVDFDNVADDGVVGEGDNVRSTNEMITGSPGPDSITGTAAAELLRGMGGNDVLYGMGGNDRLDGGAGDDRIFGGDGNDYCAGGVGSDIGFNCETFAG